MNKTTSSIFDMSLRVKTGIVLFALIVSAALLAADETDHHLESFLTSKNPNYRLQVSHIHGIGFDDNVLVLATHLGLLRFQDGSWVAVESPPHDYMGFALVEKGAYISGHPSILHADEFMNPLGVMFTEDSGYNLTPKGFYGEVDFHWLAAGYNTTSVYALTSSHPQTKAPMFAVSQNSGATWESKGIIGTQGSFVNLAAHPTDPRKVFLLTASGLYVSFEAGGFFGKLTSLSSMSALAIDRIGTKIYLGGTEMRVLDIEGRPSEMLSIPPLESGEFITGIATGPQESGLLAYATNRNNAYISRNGGTSWRKLLDAGDATR